MADTRLRAIIESIYEKKGTEAAIQDFKELDRATSQAADGGVSQLSTQTNALSGVLGKLAAAGLLAKIGQEALEFGKASVQAAGDAAEMQSKFNVVFGESAPQAQTALQALGEQVNRSAVELQGMAASIQDTFVPLGFARDEAASLSVQLTQLAVDVGSFNNVADADVMRDFQSALVGNTETVRKYGIVITEANTKQKAYEMGIAEVGTALTEQEKVQARLQLILEGTTDAHGDAIRTADSYANTQKGLEAATLDLQVALGELATGGLAVVNRKVTEGIDNLTGLVGVTNTLITSTLSVIDSLAQEGASWDDLIAKMGIMGKLTAFVDGATWGILEAYYEELQMHYKITAAMEARTARLDELRVALDQSADASSRLRTASEGEANATARAAQNAEREKEAQQKLKDALSDLQLFINGPLGKEYDDFTEKNADLEAKAAELRDTIAELGGTEWMTPAQQEQITTLQSELNNVATEIVQLDEAIQDGELKNNQEYEATQKLEDLRQKAWELEQQILALGGKPFVTAGNLEDLESAREELAKTNEAIAANAAAHDEATKRIIFDLMSQRAAMDGLSDTEMTVLNDLALSWGLIDQATHDAVVTIDSAFDDLAAGESITEVENQIRGIDDALSDTNTDVIATNDLIGEKGVGALTDYRASLLEIEEPLTNNQLLIENAADSAKKLNNQLNAIPETVDVAINISTNGNVPNLSSSADVTQKNGETAIAKAGGGDVYAGQRTWVGEQGTEMFIPNVSGTIVPNNQIGGMMGNVNVAPPIVNVYLDSQQIAAAVEVRNGQRLRQAGGAYRP